MTAFNDVAGVPATADRGLVRGVLRDNWGFRGIVLSDWACCRQLLSHGVAANRSEAAQQCIEAGCDMDMEGRVYSSKLAALVERGTVPVSLVDDSVRRILKLKMELGLFEDPYRYGDPEAAGPNQQHLQLAREAARESIVLLHNRKQLLPMEGDIKSIAVIGPLADDKDSPLGNWRAQADADSAVSVLEAVQQEFGKRMDVRHTAGCQLLNPAVKRGFALQSSVNETNLDGIDEAAELAAASDLVLLVVGEDCFQSGEARSRTRIGLPGVQPQLVQAVTKANPNTVLLVMSGRPLVLTDEMPSVGTALQVWHLGSQAGLGILDVLTGRHNPSGKLTMSFPRSVGQVPIYYNHKNTGRPTAKDPNEVWYSHYGDELNEPLYPFGHGMSYTKFGYENLRIDRERFGHDETVTVSVDVANVGDRAGTEIVQLYVRDLVASRTRPVRELRAFRRVYMEAGEQKQVDLILDQSAFAFYDDSGKYVLESGEFHIFVGGSSQAALQVTCFVERADSSPSRN
jgi:beta-glucosidase